MKRIDIKSIRLSDKLFVSIEPENITRDVMVSFAISGSEACHITLSKEEVEKIAILFTYLSNSTNYELPNLTEEIKTLGVI